MLNARRGGRRSMPAGTGARSPPRCRHSLARQASPYGGDATEPAALRPQAGLPPCACAKRQQADRHKSRPVRERPPRPAARPRQAPPPGAAPRRRQEAANEQRAGRGGGPKGPLQTPTSDQPSHKTWGRGQSDRPIRGLRAVTSGTPATLAPPFALTSTCQPINA